MARRVIDWRDDLEASRNLSSREKTGYAMVVGWLEGWRMKQGLAPGRDAAVMFWKQQVRAKERETWQLDQWAEGIRWYLDWLKACEDRGGDGRSLPERMKRAVEQAGARRGLALRTRTTYSSWVARMGAWAGTAQRAMDENVAREWLTHLIDVEKVSFSTQKQALNALVFFFRDVCGREEIDLQVRMRKTPQRMPVVLDVKEVLMLIDRLKGTHKTAAKLQYGSGLRLNELVSMRIKDVDLNRSTVTVRCGKVDRDRVTVLPDGLKAPLMEQGESARELYHQDRSRSRPGVALPTALDRKTSAAGSRWEWFWLSPARKESCDPASGITRRRQIHGGSYNHAITRAARMIGTAKRVRCTECSAGHVIRAGPPPRLHPRDRHPRSMRRSATLECAP